MSENRVVPMRDSFGAIVEAAEGEALNDLSVEYVQELFDRFGALLFRGYAADTDSFIAFTERFCGAFSTYRGGALRWKAYDREMIDGIPTLLSTTAHNQNFPIPMHGEMYYGNDRPDVLWFRCVQAPRFAGETVLADGAEIAENLSDETRALFEASQLLYIRELNVEEWQATFQTTDLEDVRRVCEKAATRFYPRDDGTLRTEFLCSAFTADGRFINSILPLSLAEEAFEQAEPEEPATYFSRSRFPLSVRLEDGQRIPEQVLRDIERAVKAVTFRIRWRNGDIAMVDNARVMHGRAKTVGSDRTIHVRMGMFDGRAGNQ